MIAVWTEFLGISLAIVVAGYLLAHYGDVIAEKTGMSGTWVGLILVATVTSLPELVTGVSAVTLANAPDLAAGDVMGSCVFNLLLIALLDSIHRECVIYEKASRGHILAAGFSILLVGLVVFSILSGDAAISIGHIGIYTPAIIALYFIAVRAVFIQEKNGAGTPSLDLRYQDITLRSALIRYCLAASVVVAAGIAMPLVADKLAKTMGWSQTFVGTLLVAVATSLPEAASTIGAVRIGALDLAIGNLFGSNLFNILALAIDDIAYASGPLLSQVSQAHALSGVSAMMMTGATILGVHYRPKKRILKVAGWVSLALVLTYVLNSWVLYLRGV
ncbi:MAG: hypothetical protein R3D51_16910 [Hyphomicrobiaceae bacterium]